MRSGERWSERREAVLAFLNRADAESAVPGWWGLPYELAVVRNELQHEKERLARSA